MATTEDIRNVVAQYVQRVAAHQPDKVADLFADHATIEDPVGTEPKIGREAIIDFFTVIAGMEETATELHWCRVAPIPRRSSSASASARPARDTKWCRSTSWSSTTMPRSSACVPCGTLPSISGSCDTRQAERRMPRLSSSSRSASLRPPQIP